MIYTSHCRWRITPVALLAAALTFGGVALAADGRLSLRMRSVTGAPLTPLAPTGQANLLLFVASDCPVSNSYAPEIQRVCREYGPRGVDCTLIYEDLDTHAGTADLDRQIRAHISEYGYAGLPAAIDRDRSAARAVKATVTPQAVVVDRSGDIRYQGRIDNLYAALGKTRQQVTSHDLRDALDDVVSGRKVRVPRTEALGCFITDPAVLKGHDHE